MDHARSFRGAPRPRTRLLALGLALAGAGCDAASGRAAGDASAARGQAEAPAHPVLYAVDGSNQDAASGSNISALASAALRSSYQAGPSIDPNLGSRVSYRIAAEVYEQICADLGGDAATRVYLTGWSRGAMVAIAVAHRLDTERCGGDAAVPVEWLGLIDAVATDMDPLFDGHRWPKRISANVTRAVHLTKQDQDWDATWGWLLATAHITADPGVSLETISDFPLSHSQMGFSAEVYAALEGDAAASGLALQTAP